MECDAGCFNYNFHSMRAADRQFFILISDEGVSVLECREICKQTKLYPRGDRRGFPLPCGVLPESVQHHSADPSAYRCVCPCGGADQSADSRFFTQNETDSGSME